MNEADPFGEVLCFPTFHVGTCGSPEFPPLVLVSVSRCTGTKSYLFQLFRWISTYILGMRVSKHMGTLKWVTLFTAVLFIAAVSGVADKVAPHWAAFLRGWWVDIRPW